MTKPVHFGTDGVRGVANEGMLAPERVLALGRALGRLARRDGAEGPVALARDPRRSSPMIAAGLAAGLASEGVEVLDLGVLPTPGLAVLLEGLGASLGAMVSASHNPMRDNGIKVLLADGGKLADDDELWLEAELDRPPASPAPTGAGVGDVRRVDAAVDRYVDVLAARFDGLSLEGMRIVVDAANGATSEAAPRILERLGADVALRFASPDGLNINDGCGAVHPEAMARDVVAEGADVGVAFDGDGDRLMLASADGSVQDGDRVLYVCGRERLAGGTLKDGVLVGTVMSNFGLELAMRALGGRLHRTPVGDRHVAAALREHGWGLGGEPSGHVIFGAEHGFVGDGLYSALSVLAVIARTGTPMHELSRDLKAVPQVLLNVPVREKPPLDEQPALAGRIEEAEAALAGEGRVLVRYSGTENLLRVMVEGTDDTIVRSEAEAIADVVRGTLGADAPATS
ncbi:MAG: phosphoglucosamine mutase [Planctomycetota bacterium JB042]